MWCHLLTIFNRRFLLRLATTILLSIALITTLFFGGISRAEEGVISATLGFQGRLLDNNGDVVPDGYYNIQFKIYQGGTGTAAGNPGGTLKWTESYINNGSATGAVEVRNGFMSVDLGSINPFGDSVDWNQSTLWLSMNIAGKAAGCTTFGTSPCADDGEMLPMKKMTASPYAMNAGAVNGKTADNFVQLAQGVQTDASTNTSSIFINKTGTGNLVQLQNTATDVFAITNDGDLEFGSNANHSISIQTSGADTDGRELAIAGGNGGSGTGSNGGNLNLQGGSAGGTNGNGGNISIDAGAGTGTGTGGTIEIGTTNASSVIIGSSGSANSGTTTIQAKDTLTVATNGTTRATFSDTNSVYFGNGVSASAPNNFTIQGTNSSAAAVAGGSLTVQGGNATTGNANGGNVVIAGGTGSGTGTSGLVVLTTPTFSTVTNDANCYTGGAVVATSCSIANSTVNNASAVIVGFSTTGQTATLPDPSNTTAGRILYVTAAAGTKDFTLLANNDTSAITMRQNTTATMLWNGSDWTAAGASNTATLQDVYNNSPQTEGESELVVAGAAGSGGMTIRDSGTNSVDGTLFEVQNSAASSLFSINNASDAIPTVQVGNGTDDADTTLLTLDKAATAPTITDEALLGSMYYDTTLGVVQCYEAIGWGSCGASPDTFVTLSPEYSNAVMNGSNLGTMTSDLCSDSLNINDGSSSQPTVCGTKETYNFYNWTSANVANQERSIYVTYQLPSNFKEFAPGSASLAGRTDSSDASVSYQTYKNNDVLGLTACGSSVPVSTGTQTTWQKAVAINADDPANCGFVAGDSIVFKITLGSANDANAYASNLNFTYSSN